MQNCLQKKKTSLKVKMTLILAILVVAALWLMTAMLNDNADWGQGGHIDGANGLSDVDKGETLPVNFIKNDMPFEDEMNNETRKNSKLYNSTKKMANSDNMLAEKVKVLMKNGKVETMELEEYVKGCVFGEMPMSFKTQAIMAQSVAVRSFTVKRMTDKTPKHKNADVCADFNCCQSYVSPEGSGISEENLEKLCDSVSATRGVIACYNGMPIEAAYHASSGYFTKNSEDVWGGKLPYLRSVKAPDGEAEISAKSYIFTFEELSELLSEECGRAVSCGSFGERISAVENELKLVDFIDADGLRFDKNDVKKALGLSSEQFDVRINKEGVTVTVYGYGHGVGLSQHGANILAGMGYGYTDILKYYYSGISFSFL